MTWGEILIQGTKQLKQADIASPNLDASLLLAHILGVSREHLLIHGDRALKPDEIPRFFGLVSRRIAGESIAYLTGYKEFWGLSFQVSPAVLVPRPDTEILVEAVLSFLQGQSLNEGQSSKRSQKPEDNKVYPGDRASGGRSLLDLCTGSGAVAIALKSACPGLEVFAADISAPALEIARANARRLLSGGQSLHEGQSITFYLSDLYDNIPGIFDIVVSNPPYIPSEALADLPGEVQREPRIALDGGRDGLELIEKIISGGRSRLTSGGRLFLEADSGQMAAIALILEKQGFQNILIYKDLAGLERVVSGKRNE
ncbi:MAG: peptide chain release factor N(5)-glutamine methyltransferase [Spirochaetaceae bacterium]|jgi:release factor glutamine methyltransferase|nr:peptide chain release factor N(5)-glutamine methyltransferase [Spirochaetaceae bacterium]